MGSCGPNHTVAITDEKKVFSWGFGGYGRLGHSETADELVPRLIKYLDGKNRGVRDVISEINGMVNMGGIYTTSKEANMYPKPVQDLSGWTIRSVACSTKGWTAACEDAVISCQPSPCYGELGCGEKKKSSAAPTMVDCMDGLHVFKVGAGPAHTLYVARNSEPKDKEALEKFTVLDQAHLED